MEGHSLACVERYCQLAGVEESSLTRVATPCVDDQFFEPSEFIAKGRLEDEASKIVLKCLYVARLGRPDDLWSVNSLAREVTKWTPTCDKRLLRLTSYLNTTPNIALHCHVGDNAGDILLIYYADASFADCLRTPRSTSGGFVCLGGANTFVPLT